MIIGGGVGAGASLSLGPTKDTKVDIRGQSDGMLVVDPADENVALQTSNVNLGAIGEQGNITLMGVSSESFSLDVVRCSLHVSRQAIGSMLVLCLLTPEVHQPVPVCDS